MVNDALHDRFEAYPDELAPRPGHADRVPGFRDYCRGLMLPLERKSIEPIAASVDPDNVQACHQSLHHLVARSGWSDREMLNGVAQQVLPHLLSPGTTPFRIIDDTGIRRKGQHSVGVGRQYCGEIGKQDNCQVAVSLSVATEQASQPVAWRLYLPTSWTDDPARRRRAGVPDEIDFATQPEIALEQVRETLEAGITPGIVLADAAYGRVTSWREQLAQWGLGYCVDVPEGISVWPPGSEPLPPQWSGQGRPPTRWQQTADHHPVSAQALAESLEANDYQDITWREGTNKPLRSRFAAVRVRVAQGRQKREPEWLLIEWPRGDGAPAKYWLSNLPADTPLDTLVATAKGRWRIERDYQALKQEFGLTHYEGRNWRGFHHHATLCTVAYGFLVMERLRCGDQKKSAPARPLPYPKATGRGVIKRAQRHVVNAIATLRWELNQAIMVALGSRSRCL